MNKAREWYLSTPRLSHEAALCWILWGLVEDPWDTQLVLDKLICLSPDHFQMFALVWETMKAHTFFSKMLREVDNEFMGTRRPNWPGWSWTIKVSWAAMEIQYKYSIHMLHSPTLPTLKGITLKLRSGLLKLCVATTWWTTTWCLGVLSWAVPTTFDSA